MRIAPAEKAARRSVACGYSTPVLPIHHTWRQWCDALWHALRMTLLFDARGVHASACWLQQIRVHGCFSSLPDDIRLVQAREDCTQIKAFLNLLLGHRLCFSRSFALCAGLRRLGYACRIVIGYEQVYQYTETPMHAYVEMDHLPISDPYDVRYGYMPVLYYGEETL